MVSKAVARRRASALDFVLSLKTSSPWGSGVDSLRSARNACQESTYAVEKAAIALGNDTGTRDRALIKPSLRHVLELADLDLPVAQAGARQTDTPAAQPRSRRNR
jgi:hypothetical protein